MIRPNRDRRPVTEVLADGLAKQTAGAPLMLSRPVTRDDLPSDSELERRRENQSPAFPLFYGDEAKQIIADYLNERGGVPAEAGSSCCEDAAQSRADVERLTAENEAYAETVDGLAKDYEEARAERNKAVNALNARNKDYAAQAASWVRERDRLSAGIEKAEAERDELKRELSDVIEVSARQYNWLKEERDALQAKLDARPSWPDGPSGSSDARTTEGWPEWLGPVIDPDNFEVTKVSHEGFDIRAPHYKAGSVELSLQSSQIAARRCAYTSIQRAAEFEAVARFIEREQAATGDEGQRIEKASEKLWLADRTGEVSWNELHVDMQCEYRDEAARLLDAGWAPPESEDDK